MRPSPLLLLSLILAAAALVVPAAARINYYKGLTTVADLESLRLLDGDGRFTKHTLVAFALPDDDGSAACALEQLEALRFPHVFFHLPGTIFEMIQVLVDPATELTQSLLQKAQHNDACCSFLFIPQNTTVAAAAAEAEAEGRRLVARSQGELEGWFWGLQCAATGPFVFKNDFRNAISIHRETRQARKLEMEWPPRAKHGMMGGHWGAKDKPESETLVVNVAPGERVVLNASNPICRGHTAIFRRWGGRMAARLVVADEDMFPLSMTLPLPATNVTAEEEVAGVVTLLGLQAKGDPRKKNAAWDPRRLQLTEDLTDIYRTRAEYNFKRLERIEHAPRRTPALGTEGYIKERVPQAVWEELLRKYDEATEEKKHFPEPDPAKLLKIENEHVPLPTVMHQHRNANPMPVSTMFGVFENNATGLKWVREGIRQRIKARFGSNISDETRMGIFRRYYNGSMLRDHVDGDGDIGAIINMGQEADEPWELHILNHQGRRHRITMEPGEMVLYQTDRVAQARPTPLRGSYYDDIFFSVEMEGLVRRPVTPVEAALEPLKPQELPGASAGLVEEEGTGLRAEL